jgi:hypothetical protein
VLAQDYRTGGPAPPFCGLPLLRWYRRESRRRDQALARASIPVAIKTARPWNRINAASLAASCAVCILMRHRRAFMDSQCRSCDAHGCHCGQRGNNRESFRGSEESHFLSPFAHRFQLPDRLSTSLDSADPQAQIDRSNFHRRSIHRSYGHVRLLSPRVWGPSGPQLLPAPLISISRERAGLLRLAGHDCASGLLRVSTLA